MAFGKKKTLRVEFVDTKTERVIGFDELTLKQIPVDFSEETWVEIDGDRWKVTKVEPASSKKALRSGTLIVHVNLVEKRTPEVEAPAVEVKEAPVFSHPSRADQLPRMSGKRQDLRLLEMGTWEWRDREMTIATNRSVVRDVFAKIEELIMLNSTVRDGKTFYTRQYDRYDFFAPLRGSKVTLEMIVTDYFPSSRAIDGLTFMGSDQVADSTFVFSIPSGIVLYGQEFDEVVRYLGVHRPDRVLPVQLREDSIKFADFMRKKGLILVDWPKRVIVEADPEAVLDYFLEGFAADAIAAARETLANSPLEPEAAPSNAPAISLENTEPIPPVTAPELVAPPIEPVAESRNPQPEITSVIEGNGIAPETAVAETVIEAVAEPPSNFVETTTVVHETVTETTVVVEEKVIETTVISHELTAEVPEIQDAQLVEETPVAEDAQQPIAEIPEAPATPDTYLEFSSPVEELEVHDTPADAHLDDAPEREHKDGN